MKSISGTIVLISLLLSACGRTSSESGVTFVDHSDVYAKNDTSNEADPLLLVLEVSEDGKLALNKIDVGTTADMDPLSSKLDAIFEDRTRAAIDQKVIVIELKGNVSGEVFERLTKTLTDVKASPIKVIKSGV